MNDEAAIDNTNYQVALMRYLSEFNDDKTGKELKDSLPEFARIKAIVDRNYKFRKSVLINKVRDYELTIYLKDELGGIISDSKFTDSLLADYKSVCHNPEYIAAIDKLYLRAMSVLPGNAAPEFSLRNAEGKTVSLSSYKGKTVYIDFWATWCVPCIAAMPKSKALEEKLKDHRDIVFLYIDVRDDSTRWKNYLAKEKAEGDHLFADKEQSANLYRVYNFNGIPHYALLDKNGKIVEANMDGPGDVAEKKILKAAK